MSVSLTQSAAKHVESMIAKRGNGVGLRLGTKKSGCTGFAYVVDYADDINDNDLVFESFGVKIIVEPDCMKMVDGMEIDYLSNNVLNQGFEFKNPNIKDMCGCGESFSV